VWDEDIWETLKRPHLAIDTEAGLVRLYLTLGNPTEALTRANKILDYLDTYSIEGILSPFAAYLACIQALQATNDPRADAVLAEAKTVLMETAVKIEKPALRASYLENVPTNRVLAGL
jgi:hypothetical protein